MNIGLDLLFVPVFRWGIQGAAFATVIAQYVSGIGIFLYFLKKCRRFISGANERRFDACVLRDILGLSGMTCAQQSCMNFGILLVQRLVDNFRTITRWPHLLQELKLIHWPIFRFRILVMHFPSLSRKTVVQEKQTASEKDSGLGL